MALTGTFLLLMRFRSVFDFLEGSRRSSWLLAQGRLGRKKGIPVNFEVHAINGLPLVPQNHGDIMNHLKSRPVTLDIRPQGWKPKEKVKELERKRTLEEAEKRALIQVEGQRRKQVAREAAKVAEREAAEHALREEKAQLERKELADRAREERQKLKNQRDVFEQTINAEPVVLLKAAAKLMEAEYGTAVSFPEGTGRRGLPLRLMTRRKEVAWLWAGQLQELIGGGVPDADTWS